VLGSVSARAWLGAKYRISLSLRSGSTFFAVAMRDKRRGPARREYATIFRIRQAREDRGLLTALHRGRGQRRCRCGNIANDVQPPSDDCNDKQGKSKNRRLAPQPARWEFPAGGSFVNSLLVFTQHRRIFRILGHLFKLRIALASPMKCSTGCSGRSAARIHKFLADRLLSS
jgi:hypothetical protein